ESIEILRGASAGAIYGQKASNGVVIIKTKRGQAGVSQVGFTQRFGFSEISNTVGSRVFRDTTDAFGAFAPNATRDTATRRLIRGLCALPNGACPFFDLERELAGIKPLSFESGASVSGGTENTQYFASGTVKDDGGIIQNTGFKRQALRLNLDQRLGSSVQTAALMKNNEDVYRFIGGANLQWDAVQSGGHYLRFIALGGADYFNQNNALFFPPELQFEPNDGLPGTSLLTNSGSLNLNLNT